MVKSQELKSDPFYTPLDQINNTLKLPWKPSEEPKTNSQEDKKLSFQTSGDSLNSPDLSSKKDGKKELFNQMVLLLSSSDLKDLLLKAHYSKPQKLPEMIVFKHLNFILFLIKSIKLQKKHLKLFVNTKLFILNPMQKTQNSVQKFKKFIQDEGHYSYAYINFLVNLIDSQQSLNTYQQIYELINKNSQKIIDYFMNNPEELSLIENKNPLCFNSIKEYFLQILRVVHTKYGKDIPKFKEGLKITSRQFKTVLENSPSRIVKNAEIIAREPGLKRIMVYSYSKSIALSLKNLASILEGSLQIFVCKGGQLEQGSRMYKQLQVSRTGAKIFLINDNQIGYYLEKVDIVLAGAQVILQNGSILNRAGTLCLAIAAHTVGKKFYVFAQSYKYLKRVYLTGSDIPQLIKKTKNQNEVAMDDLTQSKYIDLFFTDIGVFTPQTVSSQLANLFQ